MGAGGNITAVGYATVEGLSAKPERDSRHGGQALGRNKASETLHLH